MRWLFVIGVGLEIAGALLVVVSLVLPIVLRQWSELAARGYLYPRGGPTVEDMREPAFAAVGAVLLLVGFALQLAGYVVEFRSDALIAVATGTAIGAFVVGLAFARFSFARFLLGKAKTHDQTERGDVITP